ncbi:glutamine--fructose-6-phosphate transaminase (isomerizing), partial [Acinetobacter baumannii]
VALAMLGVAIAQARNLLDRRIIRLYARQLLHVPVQVERALGLDAQIRQWAARIVNKRHALFLGRGPTYPVALEGALKLKEISYIH